MAAKKIPLKDRFWNKVNKNGPTIRPELGPCWEWIAGRLKGRGYGMIKNDQRQMCRTHRVAFELTNGPIPEGLWVLHRCDNPPCVNPDHLYAGTRKDNTRDALERGRHGDHRGERGSMSKLKNADIKQIRTLRMAGETQSAIAHRYGVNQSTIFRICARRYWSHVH